MPEHEVYLCELQDQDGTWYDVTDALDLESLGGLSFGIEDDLLQFRTGDITIGFDNADDRFRAIFLNADPFLTWRLRLYRNARKYFEGVLFIPGNVRFNDIEALCEITAFGYLKLLEGISAETVKRTFGTLTGTGTAGTVFLTIAPTAAGIERDDRLRISTSSASEEVEVDSVSGNQLLIRGGLTQSWSSAAVDVLTPFYRRKTPEFLVRELYLAAGILNPVIDVSVDFSVPVATALNTGNLTRPEKWDSGCEVSTRLRLRRRPSPTDGQEEYEATSPTTGDWSLIADASEIGGDTPLSWLVDWRIHELTQPATLVAFEFPETDEDVSPTFRHGGLGVDYDAVPPARLLCRRVSTNGISATHTVSIDTMNWDSGTRRFPSFTSQLVVLQTYQHGDINSQMFMRLQSDFDSNRNLVFFSYQINAVFPTGPGGRFGYYDRTGLNTVVLEQLPDADITFPGDLQFSVTADIMLRLKADGVTLEGWRASAKQFNVVVPAGLQLRSIRYMGGKFWVGIHIASGRTKLLVADLMFTTVQLLDFSDTASGGFDPEEFDQFNWLFHYGTDQLVGRIDQQMVVIDTLFAGIVPYADFEEKSLAGALVEIAKVTNAIAFVDEDFQGYFVSRTSRVLESADGPKVLDDLVIEDEGDLVWEHLYGAFRVRNGAIEALVGDVAEQGRAFEVESELTTNLSIAFAVAASLKDYYSRTRRELRVTVFDDETLYRPLSIVRRGNTEWYVYEIDHALTDWEVRLRLVEIV